MTPTLIALLVCLAFVWWHHRRIDARLLDAHIRGYAQAHDDIYQSLMGTPDEAHRRLGREAVRQRSVARDQ